MIKIIIQTILFLVFIPSAFANEKADQCIKNAFIDDSDGMIYFGNCDLTSEDMPGIVTFLKSHPDYTFVDLSANNSGSGGIGDEGFRQLLSIKTLKDVSVSKNNISDKGVASLIDTNLTDLVIDNNNITSKGARIISQIKTLTTVSLKNNFIGDEGAIALGNTNIEVIDVANNRITSQGVIGLAKNSKIINLDISRNDIGDTGIQAISKLKIEDLNANLCDIDDEGITVLAKMESLQTIEVDKNRISDEGIHSFLKTSANYISISMHNNYFTKVGFDELHKRFGDAVIAY